MKLNILGTEYTLITNGKVVDYPGLEDSDGYCNYQVKEIILSGEDHDGTLSYDKYMQKVLRHEIIHAFLYESGLHAYATDELLVDWLAIQLPKIAELLDRLHTS